MKKLYDKNELAFALLWIGLYVLGMNIALRFCGGFDDLAAKTVEVAEKWAPVADRLWKENREARARGEFHK